MILGVILHCPGETREFELVTQRSVEGNMETLVLAQVCLPLHPLQQVLKDLFYPYQRLSAFIIFMTAIC